MDKGAARWRVRLQGRSEMARAVTRARQGGVCGGQGEREVAAMAQLRGEGERGGASAAASGTGTR